MKIKVGNSGGFCNRLYAWECLYEISKINNAELESDFPELNFISLPNTVYKKINYESQTAFINNDPGNGYRSFNSNYMNNFILDKGFNYYATCGFGFNRYFNTIHNNSGIYPKQHMKLKDNILFEKIKNVVKDCVGVHIRRGETGNGQSNFIIGKAIPDFWYLSIMNQIKEIFPKIKFYISADTEDSELNVFYNNFDVVTYKDIISTTIKSNYIKNAENFNQFLIDATNNEIIRSADLAGLVDFFSLSFSKMLICSVSTWSMCAYEMNNIPIIWPECSDQKISSLRKHRGSLIEKSIDIKTILT